MPVGQSGATGPWWDTDKMVKVATPAMDVTKVGQGDGGDLGGRAAGSDQDGRQDRAAADAINAADASPRHSLRGQN